MEILIKKQGREKHRAKFDESANRSIQLARAMSKRAFIYISEDGSEAAAVAAAVHAVTSLRSENATPAREKVVEATGRSMLRVSRRNKEKKTITIIEPVADDAGSRETVPAGLTVPEIIPADALFIPTHFSPERGQGKVEMRTISSYLERDQGDTEATNDPEGRTREVVSEPKGDKLREIRVKYEKLNNKIDIWESQKKQKAKRRQQRAESEAEVRRMSAFKLSQIQVADINKMAEAARAHAARRRRKEEIKLRTDPKANPGNPIKNCFCCSL